MNGLDIGILIVVVIFAVRGFSRGFLRECFALVALVAGLAGALTFSDSVAAAIGQRVSLPAPACAAIAFLGIFLVLQTSITLVGILLDRVTKSVLVGGLNRTAGALFATAKAGIVIAFVLLFLHLFPVVPKFDQQIATSSIARPMVSTAGTIIRAGLRVAGGPGGPRHA